MVLKLCYHLKRPLNAFESSVNSDGTQTTFQKFIVCHMFESSVNSDGTQTLYLIKIGYATFESSVNSDGTQTKEKTDNITGCLRVV